MPKPVSLLDQPTVYGARAKVGVIVPPTNTANEAEWNLMAPQGVSIHAARMPLHSDTATEAGRSALYADITHHSQELNKASTDIIVYGCTAGSLIHPVDQIATLITTQTGCRGLSTAQALVDALTALSVTRLAMITPYHDALNAHEQSFFEQCGFDVVALGAMGYGAGGADEFRNIARISTDAVVRLTVETDRPEAQAILISCTDLATASVISTLEQRLNKPVISSNSATLWRALRTVGVDDSLLGFGQLLEHH